MIANLAWVIRRLVAPEWRLVSLCAATMIIGSLLPAVQPIIARHIVDGLVGAGATPAVWRWTALMGATFLVPGLLHNLGSLPGTTLEERTIRRLDQMVIDAGAAMPDIAALERPAVHDRIEHVRTTIGMCIRLPQECLQVVALGLGALTLLVSFGSLTWWMPVLLLVAGVPHLIGERRMMDVRFLTMRDQSRAAREMDYCLTAASEPRLAKEVRAFGLGEFFLRRFDARSSRALVELAGVRLRSVRWSVMGAHGYGVAVVVCFGYVARQATAGAMSAGDIALFLPRSPRCSSPCSGSASR